MEKPNIILIVCDTVRKDILEIYGGPARTPNLKRLAKDSMVYEDCIAPSPWTFPSHTSLFTGQYPSRHRVHEDERLKLFALAPLNEKVKYPRLAKYLGRRDYTTVGISNNIMVSRFCNFDIGFDYFFNTEVDPWLEFKEMGATKRLGADKMEIAKRLVEREGFGSIFKYAKGFLKMRALEKFRDYPFDKGATITNSVVFNSRLAPSFFLFINLMEAHEPYRGYRGKEIFDDFTDVKRISPQRVAFLKRRYIEEVEYLDTKLGSLLEGLKDRGLYSNSLIIVTSDHGQAFYEHSYMFHDTYLYDEIVRVPLLVKYPGGRRFKAREGYQSLVNVFDMIKDVVKGGDDSRLTTETVFSESFGVAKTMPESYDSRRNYVAETHEKTRKAVYKGGFKLTVNGTDGTVEEFLKDGKDALPDAHKKKARELVREIRMFNKDAGFRIPDV